MKRIITMARMWTMDHSWPTVQYIGGVYSALYMFGNNWMLVMAASLRLVTLSPSMQHHTAII